MKIAFLNVGQGDSTVITLPDGVTGIVVDCYTNAVKKYIDKNGITDVPYIFLTHSDYDHASQIVSLLRNYTNTTFYYFPDSLKLIDVASRKRTLLKRLNKLIDLGLQVEEPKTGDKWQIQNVGLEVLHPSTADRYKAWERLKYGDTNNISTLLRVSFAGNRVLLTGDLAEKGWEAVVKRGTDLKADVLKFPHHGSFFEMQENHALDKLIEQIDPLLVIISVGTVNSYNHPHPSVIEMLDAHPRLLFRCTQATSNCFPTLSTPDEATPCGGDIEVIFREGGLEVKTEFNPAVCGRKSLISYGIYQKKMRKQ